MFMQSHNKARRARAHNARARVCLRLQQFVTLIYNILSNFRSQLVTI